MPETLTLSPTARAALLDLAARTGRDPLVLLEEAVVSYRGSPTPVTHIPGVDPAEVWAAAAQVEAGQVVEHDELMARLRSRP
ncbi:MAG: hypothetical protein K2X87_22360 [Gemmataceae bacterium]|nr:hypothetical protein [Gemmataceae bacterium]